MPTPYRRRKEDATFCWPRFWAFFAVVLALASPSFSVRSQTSETNSRFQFSGDGTLNFGGEKIRYRAAGGADSAPGWKRLHQIFRAPNAEPGENLDRRFVELLDYVQDHFDQKPYQLISGYRSPTLNQNLRRQKKLAAQSSMHVEGAAGDLKIAGVPSEQVFEFVKSLNCCGIGWYHSAHFHLDAGPARFWNEKTSKTEEQAPQRNEKIILHPVFDRYHAGESVRLQWMRVTDYPFGVENFELLSNKDSTKTWPLLNPKNKNPICRKIIDRREARSDVVTLPKDIEAGEYSVRVKLCENEQYEKMPTEILSRSFQIF